MVNGALAFTKNALIYFGKRTQVSKVAFFVKEQNVSAISTDINYIMILSYLKYKYFLAGWVFILCIRFGVEDEHTK